MIKQETITTQKKVKEQPISKHEEIMFIEETRRLKQHILEAENEIRMLEEQSRIEER